MGGKGQKAWLRTGPTRWTEFVDREFEAPLPPSPFSHRGGLLLKARRAFPASGVVVSKDLSQNPDLFSTARVAPGCTLAASTTLSPHI